MSTARLRASELDRLLTASLEHQDRALAKMDQVLERVAAMEAHLASMQDQVTQERQRRKDLQNALAQFLSEEENRLLQQPAVDPLPLMQQQIDELYAEAQRLGSQMKNLPLSLEASFKRSAAFLLQSLRSSGEQEL